jgi:hypothetical protein
MNGLCGEDLGWFWNAWYFDFNAPDQELKKQDDTQQVKVVNKGGIPLPIRLNVLYDDDHETVIEKSIWSWSGHQDAVLVDIPEYDKVKSIQLGNAAIPDIDRSNNTLEYKNQLSD